MRKLLLTLALVLSFCSLLSAQNLNISFTLDATDQIGPNPANRVDIRGTGVNLFTFTWNATGTVSAGACALQGGTDGTTFGTTIIAAQTVTSSGGPAAVTSNTTSNYARINCTTPIAGSGSVQFRLLGWIFNPTTLEISGAALTSLQAIETAVEDTAARDVTRVASASQGCGTKVSFIETMAQVMKQQVCSAACTINQFEIYSKDATPVYAKLYNELAATVDETDTPVWRIPSPEAPASGLSGNTRNYDLPLPFSVAATFRVTTGIADSDTSPLSANEVIVNVCYKQ